MDERPKWDKGSSLWDQTTQDVDNYISILERKIVELGNAYESVSNELEICKRQIHMSERKEQLSVKWARGEVEN